MSSTGNDIVALTAVNQQRTHHSRFYSKILSEAECALYDRQPPAGMLFENFVWLLWSVKESVYKYLKRTEPGLVFAPTRIIIQKLDGVQLADEAFAEVCRHEPYCGKKIYFDNFLPQLNIEAPPSGGGLYKGMALFGPCSFYFQSVLHPEFIATVAGNNESFTNIGWGFRSISQSNYDHQSAAVRIFALDHLHRLVPGIGHREDLRIEKNGQGCPILYKGAEELNIPLSLAHHGHFISWSFYFSREGRSVIS